MRYSEIKELLLMLLPAIIAMGIGIAGAMNLEKFEGMVISFFISFSSLMMLAAVVAILVPRVMSITEKANIFQLWIVVSILCVLSILETHIVVWVGTSLTVTRVFFSAISILFLFALSAIVGYLFWNSIENLIPGKKIQERNCL